MNAAMRSVKVPRSFFVINSYWTDFDNIVEKAKTNADQWVSIDGGEIFIFEYELDQASAARYKVSSKKA